MGTISIGSLIIFLLHAFIGWGLCGAIIGIGKKITAMEITLIAHAIGAPIIFILTSLIYFKLFHYTSPVITAIGFVTFALLMDVFVVSLLIEKNFDMFKSILGLWIPMALIFLSILLTGWFVVT